MRKVISRRAEVGMAGWLLRHYWELSFEYWMLHAKRFTPCRGPQGTSVSGRSSR
jgi:hypothetical protein